VWSDGSLPQTFPRLHPHPDERALCHLRRARAGATGAVVEERSYLGLGFGNPMSRGCWKVEEGRVAALAKEQREMEPAAQDEGAREFFSDEN